MDIYNYLHKDHEAVAALIEKVIATENTSKREALFKEIKQELTLHADSEEKTFYKAIEDATRSENVEEKMEHAHHEHDEIRELLKTLSKMPVTEEGWMEQFGEFKHAVTHHVEEEEEDLFKKARKYLSKEQAQELAKEMDTLKKHLKFQPKAA